MNYLAAEIETALKEQGLAHKKLDSEELCKLTSELRAKFFISQKKILDPIELIKSQKHHDPDFWQKVDQLQPLEKPILIVHDDHPHAWELETSKDLKTLFSETTGFPFWITDTRLSFLIYMDDHDCVHTAHSEQWLDKKI